MSKRNAAAVGGHPLARKCSKIMFDAGLGSNEIAVLQRLEVTQDLSRKGLVNLPECDVIEFQSVSRQQTRDGRYRRHEQSFSKDIDSGHLEIDQTHAWQIVWQPFQALIGCDPNGGGSVGQRRAVARRQRATSAGAVEDRL